MKKIALSAICCLAALLTFAQNKNGIAIIPEPVSVITKDGQFTLPKHILIQAGSSAEEKLVSSFLRGKLATASGLQVTVRNSFSVPATIKLVLNTKPDTSIGKEGYQLWAGKKGITIAANQWRKIVKNSEVAAIGIESEDDTKAIAPGNSGSKQIGA